MYARIMDGKVSDYPFNPKKLREEYPNTSFPREMSDDMLADYSVYPVIETVPPEINIFEIVAEELPIFINNVWQQQWKVIPAPAPEIITRRQAALQLLALNTINSAEALAMTKFGDTPAPISAIFDQQVADGHWTYDQRVLAEIDFAAANYHRNNQLLPLMGMTEVEIDQFFIVASTL